MVSGPSAVAVAASPRSMPTTTTAVLSLRRNKAHIANHNTYLYLSAAPPSSTDRARVPNDGCSQDSPDLEPKIKQNLSPLGVPMFLRSATSSLILFCLLFLAGCGDSSDYVFTSSPAGQTASVQLRSPLAQTTVPSNVARFRASGYSQEQTKIFGPVTVEKAAQVEWTDVPLGVRDFVVEYLDINGGVVGVARVQVELVAGQTYIINSPSIVLITATLQSLTISPTLRTVVEGSSIDFTATGHFSDNTTRNLTSVATWTSSEPTVATVEQGEAQGLIPGTSIITANFGDFTAQATLVVTAGPPVPLPDLTLVSGQTYTFNTLNGELSPPIGGSITAPGWDNDEGRLELSNFTVENGAILNVTGGQPFRVRADANISMAGSIDYSGQVGADGVDQANGQNGQNGGDINLFATGSLTATGTLNTSGGQGGDAANVTVQSDLTVSTSSANGGRGGNAGSITLVGNENQNLDSATYLQNGGNGGCGGNIAVTGKVSASGSTDDVIVTITSGDGGVGGNGTDVAGYGGDGGAVSAGSFESVSSPLVNQRTRTRLTVFTGAGGAAGQCGDDQGSFGGDGGAITSTGDCLARVRDDGQDTLATAELHLTTGTGGNGGYALGQGGDGGHGGAFDIAGNVWSHTEGDGSAEDSSASAVLTSGNGGQGAESAAHGGDGGNGGAIGIGGKAAFTSICLDTSGDLSTSTSLTTGSGGNGGAGEIRGGNGGDGGELKADLGLSIESRLVAPEGVPNGNSTVQATFQTGTGGSGASGGERGGDGGNGGNQTFDILFNDFDSDSDGVLGITLSQVTGNGGHGGDGTTGGGNGGNGGSSSMGDESIDISIYSNDERAGTFDFISSNPSSQGGAGGAPDGLPGTGG